MLERRYRLGKPCKPMESKPSDVFPDTFYIWEAFWILNKARGVTPAGTPQAISLVEIKAWMDIFGIEKRKEFINGVYTLDSEYLTEANKKQDKKGE